MSLQLSQFDLAELTSDNAMPPQLHNTVRLPNTKTYLLIAYLYRMWEMVSHSTPWEGLTNVAIIYQVAVLKARNPIPNDPAVCPPRLASLIARCWITEPRLRPPCSEVVSELLSIIEEHNDMLILQQQRVVAEGSPPSAMIVRTRIVDADTHSTPAAAAIHEGRSSSHELGKASEQQAGGGVKTLYPPHKCKEGHCGVVSSSSSGGSSSLILAGVAEGAGPGTVNLYTDQSSSASSTTTASVTCKSTVLPDLRTGGHSITVAADMFTISDAAARVYAKGHSINAESANSLQMPHAAASPATTSALPASSVDEIQPIIADHCFCNEANTVHTPSHFR
jgi:hypothetical protein